MSKLERVAVILERRPDGGLRVYSDELPGLILSSSDAVQTLHDIPHVVQTLLSKPYGDWFPNE